MSKAQQSRLARATRARVVEARAKARSQRSPYLKGVQLGTLRIVPTASPVTSVAVSSVSQRAGAPVACTTVGALLARAIIRILNVRVACSEKANRGHGRAPRQS